MWKVFIAILSALLSTVSPALVKRNLNYIVGGERISVADAPYQAAIIFLDNFSGAGSIVTPLWILTAGHCISYNDGALLPVASLYVRVGTADANVVTEEDHPADGLFLHERYDTDQLDNDIGLVRLGAPLQFSQLVSCIQMAPPGTPAITGETLRVSGYGLIDPNGPQPPSDTALRAIDLTIVDHEDCRERYMALGRVVNDRMICAASPGKDSCTYDSGGPAVHGNQLVGVVSNGKGCADPNFPGIYTQVSAERDWIDATILFNSGGDDSLSQCR